MSQDFAIKIRNLNKTFGSLKAVEGLNVDVEKNNCFGFIGPNGAGKTTTLSMLYGKTAPDRVEGTLIDVFGFNPIKDALAIKAFSGIVPQQDNLDSELNVFDNLLIYSNFYGMSFRNARKRIAELLAFMELQDKAKAKIKELSGGMKRRLTIARALLNNPKLLILDEPTTGLDPQVRHLIWNKLRDLKESGVTILLTTHYMEEAFQICDRIFIMDKAKKIIEGEPRQLLAENLEKYVMEIYGVCIDEKECIGLLDKTGVRYEFHADALIVFCNEVETLTMLGSGFMGRNHYIRQSNLEDLFLKVTGRSLNELQ